MEDTLGQKELWQFLLLNGVRITYGTFCHKILKGYILPTKVVEKGKRMFPRYNYRYARRLIDCAKKTIDWNKVKLLNKKK